MVQRVEVENKELQMWPARIAVQIQALYRHALSHRSFPAINAVLKLLLQACRQLPQRLFPLIMSSSERFLMCPFLTQRLCLRLLKTTLQRKK